jgi:predicted transcriptional regulator
MAESATISVRISAETKARLARLAESTKRSQAFLAAEAIDAFVELNEWQVAAIRRAVEEADAGGPFAADEDVSAWLLSWGTDDERPPPKAKIRRP